MALHVPFCITDNSCTTVPSQKLLQPFAKAWACLETLDVFFMCITCCLFLDLTVHSVLASYLNFWVVHSLIWGLIAIIETLLTIWES